MAKHKQHKKRRVVLAFVFTIITACLVGIVYVSWTAIENSQKNSEQNKVFTDKDGRGGDPKHLKNLYDDSRNAYKKGDKQKAQDIAKQALEYNKQLTNDQRQEIVGNTEIMLNLYDMSRGKSLW